MIELQDRNERRLNLINNMPLNSDDWLVVWQMTGSGGAVPPIDIYFRDDNGNIFTDDLLESFTIDL